jgi:TP901 family phage tail tape measure protein
MADINISASAAQARQEVADLNKQLQGIGTQFRQIGEIVNDFNKKGNLTQSVVSGIDSEGRKLTVTLEKTKAGLTATNTKLREQKEYIDALKTPTNTLNSVLTQLSSRYRDLEVVRQKFNSADVLNTAKVQGIDAFNKKVTLTIQNVQGLLQVVNKLEGKDVSTKRDPLPRTFVGDSSSTVNDYVTRLSAQYRDLTIATEKQNTSGRTYSATLQGIAADGRRATISLQALNGELINAGTKLSRNTASQSISLPVIPIPRDFVSANSRTVADFIGQLSTQYSRLRVTSESLNRANQTFAATLKGIAADGREATISLQSVNGELSQMPTRIGEIPKARATFTDLRTSIEGVSRSLNYFITYKAFNLITTQVRDSFEAIQKYQVQISLIRTLSQENQLSFNQWAQEIKAVSNELGSPLQDTAEAVFLTISNQVAKGRQALEFVREATQLSRTTGATVAQSANLLSSAINAYGKSASDAAELSAFFFKVIDEGRVVAGELSDSFGTSAVLAKELGVSYQDFGATLAFITQAGVKTDTAMTFLRNTLLQMEKPSEALIAYFNQIGVSSGKAAVSASGGFGNFIQRLIKDIKDGNLEIAKLFPELRSQQAIAGAFGRPEILESLNKRLNDTAATAQNFKNAIEIREESDSATITKELNKLQNALTVDLGSKLASLTKDILLFSAAGNGTVKGLNNLLILGRDAIAFFVAYRTVTAITTGIISGYNAAVAATAGATAATATATNVATVATLRFNQAVASSIVGLVAAIGTLILVRRNFSTNLLTETTDKIDAIDEAARRRSKKFETPTVVATSGIDTFINGLKTQFTGAAAALAEFQKGNNKTLEDIRNQNKKNADQIGESFKLYIESLKNGLEEIRRKISDSRSIILDLTRSVLEFKKLTDDIAKQSQTKFGTDAQKLQFFDKEIGRTESEARKLFAKGDKISIDEANKLLEQNVRLLEQRLDLIVQGKRQILQGENIDPEFRNQLDRRRDADFRGRFDFKGNPILEVDTDAFRKKLDTVAKLQEDLSKKTIEIKKKEIEQLSALEDKEKIRVSEIEKAFKAFNDFSAFDKGGDIKAEFKDKITSRLNPEKLKLALDQVSDQLRKVAGTDFSTRLNLEQAFNQRKKDLIAEAAAAERVEIIRNNQIELDRLRDKFEQEANLNKGAIKTASAGSESSVQNQRDRFDALDKLQAELVKRDSVLATKGGEILRINPNSRTENQKAALDQALKSNVAFQDFNTALTRYKESLTELQRDRQDVQGQLIPKRERILESVEAFEKLRKALTDLDNLSDKSNRPSFLTVPESKTNENFRGVLSQLSDELNNLKAQFNNASGAVDRQKILESDFSKVAKSLQDVSKAFPDAVKTTGDSIKESTDRIQKFIESLQGLNGQLNGIKPNANGIPGFADGGFVGGRPGVDANLARLSRGEYVVNARSAYQFSDVLTAINRSRGNVNTFRGGDIMNTRVGDIVINYQGSGNGEVDARKLGRQIQRQLRRGTL